MRAVILGTLGGTAAGVLIYWFEVVVLHVH